MIGVEGINGAQRDLNANSGAHQQLSQAEKEEFEVRAALRAIPADRRAELLASLQAVFVGANGTL